MVNELDGLVVVKELTDYEEVVAETCDYIKVQADSHSPRQSSVGIETLVTFWDVKVAETNYYLRSTFLMNYYSSWNHKVTIKVNLYPTKTERTKTKVATITIVAIIANKKVAE